MVESGGLENRCAGNPGTEGSNPSPSAQATCSAMHIAAAAATPATVRTWLPARPLRDPRGPARGGLAAVGVERRELVVARHVVGDRHDDLAEQVDEAARQQPGRVRLVPARDRRDDQRGAGGGGAEQREHERRLHRGDVDRLHRRDALRGRQAPERGHHERREGEEHAAHHAAADGCGDGERDERGAHRAGTPAQAAGGLGGVGREVARLAPERVADAVGGARVAPVETTSANRYVSSSTTSAGTPCSAQLGRVLLERDRHVAQRAPGRGGDDRGGVGERQRVWAGQLVEPADVAVVGERRDGDVGEVVDVEERRRHVAARQPDLAAEHVVEHVVLAEVLHEPGGSAGRSARRPWRGRPARRARPPARRGRTAARCAARPCAPPARRTRSTASTAPGTAMSG